MTIPQMSPSSPAFAPIRISRNYSEKSKERAMSNLYGMLDTLSDDELHGVRTRVDELLKAHDEERKAKALADARALKAKALADARAVLASAGLSLKDMGAKKPRS